MDYSNLKSKTIFDFCDDEEMLADLIIISKEEYLKQIKEYPLYDARTLIEFAELTNNNIRKNLKALRKCRMQKMKHGKRQEQKEK